MKLYIYCIVYYNSSYKSTFMDSKGKGNGNGNGYYQVWEGYGNGKFRRTFECGQPRCISSPPSLNIDIVGDVLMHYGEKAVCDCGEKCSNAQRINLLIAIDTNLYNMSERMYLLYVNEHSCIHFLRV